jgi:hypothetical protein
MTAVYRETSVGASSLSPRVRRVDEHHAEGLHQAHLSCEGSLSGCSPAFSTSSQRTCIHRRQVSSRGPNTPTRPRPRWPRAKARPRNVPRTAAPTRTRVCALSEKEKRHPGPCSRRRQPLRRGRLGGVRGAPYPSWPMPSTASVSPGLYCLSSVSCACLLGSPRHLPFIGYTYRPSAWSSERACSGPSARPSKGCLPSLVGAS